jgi:hypothetical protein
MPMAAMNYVGILFRKFQYLTYKARLQRVRMTRSVKVQMYVK